MNLTHAIHACGRLTSLEAPVVHVVDRDDAVRAALDPLIRGAGWQPSLAASAEEFLSRPRSLKAGCLLVDLHLPGRSGLDLQRAVLERVEMPVIFMAAHADVPSTVQAMKAGAFEFLTKPLAGHDLVLTLAAAIESSHVALRQFNQELALQQRYESLTHREREVLRLLITGRLNKQVGGELGISEITVKAHRGKVMRKMEARSFAELISMASRLFRPHAERLSDYLGRGMNATPS